MPQYSLEDFIKESNEIEGIYRVRDNEIAAHERLLSLEVLTVHEVSNFVAMIAKVGMRNRPGMNVRVGDHIPMAGGPEVVRRLMLLLENIKTMTPYQMHCEYETLHPFMDGNGRSGRAIWLWQMGGLDNVPLGFKHTWYYQSLQASR